MLDEKIKELENILAKLERADTTLEEGVAFFEKGVALTRECLAELTAGKGRITKLKKEMDGLIESPYETDGDI